MRVMGRDSTNFDQDEITLVPGGRTEKVLSENLLDTWHRPNAKINLAASAHAADKFKERFAVTLHFAIFVICGAKWKRRLVL